MFLFVFFLSLTESLLFFLCFISLIYALISIISFILLTLDLVCSSYLRHEFGLFERSFLFLFTYFLCLIIFIYFCNVLFLMLLQLFQITSLYSPPPSLPPTSTVNPLPVPMSLGTPCMLFDWFFHLLSESPLLPPPLFLLSVCSMVLSLWFSFAH